MLIQVYLTWTFVFFPATQVSVTQLTHNESSDASSTTRQSFSSTVSLQKTTSAPGTSGKSWKHTLCFPIQTVKKTQITLNLFICCALSWNESHLLIHAGYAVPMSSSYEVMMSDGWTSKHSAEILNVITGGYKLQKIIAIFIYAVCGHCVALTARGVRQDKFSGCKAKETKEKTAIIFTIVNKYGGQVNACYQLNYIVQSTTWSHARSKRY